MQMKISSKAVPSAAGEGIEEISHPHYQHDEPE